MGHLRVFLLANRRLSAVLLAAALCIKALVPAGFMVAGGQPLTLTVSICADASGTGTTREIIIPAKADRAAGHGQAKGECAFGALAMGALGGADTVLLALALAFVLALGFAPHAAPDLPGTRHLRPPLRGPPLAA